MGIEENSGSNQKHYDNGHLESYREDHQLKNGHDQIRNDHDTHDSQHRNSLYGNAYQNISQPIITKVRSNPKLKFALIDGAIILLLLAIVLIIALFPLLSNIWKTIGKSSLQGLLEKFIEG